MQFFLLIVFLVLYVIDYSKLSGFNLDHTDHLLNGLDRDCLYYNDHAPEDMAFQNIEYCIRFQVNEPAAENKNPHPRFTFDDLRQANITSDQLYTWLAPVDLIEHYQSYLENKNSSSSKFLFYNCTYPWFGSRCEYSFDQPESNFSQQVETSFEMKRDVFRKPEVLQKISCYIHLQCDRAGDRGQTPGACLDWREVCDGKVDCLDGGHDEEQCWQLEINECDKESEFRCHIGLCIHLDFLDDDPDTADCLDQSDEGFTGLVIVANPPLAEMKDVVKPIFRYEEHMCYPKSGRRVDFTIECGYLSCVLFISDRCLNAKTTVLRDAYYIGANVSEECYKSISCLIDGQLVIDNVIYLCKTSLISALPESVKQHCPALIIFPPIMFGHVRFVYRNNQSWNLNIIRQGFLTNPPEYICYNAKLCDHNLFSNPLHPSIDLLGNNSTCRSFNEFAMYIYDIQQWDQITKDLYILFRTCPSYHQPPSISHYSNLYTCSNSSKIISKHRLVDQVKDCLYEDDESYTESCSLSIPNHRLECAINERKVCLARARVNDDLDDCDNNIDDRYYYEDQLSGSWEEAITFTKICDGFTEILPILIDGRNETDETECAYFPCNNIYTRCDGFWNCLDGVDEVNCERPSICPLMHHLCLSPIDGNFTCLHIHRINDGIIDCLGATDELRFCHEKCTSSLCPYYQCSNSGTCISFLSICQNTSQCSMTDVISTHLCQTVRPPSVVRCVFGWYSGLTRVEDFFCKLEGYTKTIISHLSLIIPTFYDFQSRNNLEKTLTRTAVVATTKQMMNEQMVWYCDRGIAIRHLVTDNNSSELVCLCPPEYYGPLCQYQNQRVSLTVRIIIFSHWHTVFTIVMTLRDDQQGLIESHEQFNYLPIHDCRKKFNVYLLYSSRPKNTSTNYTVRIDIYNKHTMEFHASWSFPVLFPFLPVHRLPVQLQVPTRRIVTQVCEQLTCGIHGHCLQYVNNNVSFCHCDEGWTGIQCDIQYACHCSSDSLCLGSNICLCPLGKLGSRCYQKHSICPCENNGTCMHHVKHLSQKNNSHCVCSGRYYGRRCENNAVEIVVSFGSDVEIPLSIHIHFIRASGKLELHNHTTIFKRIPVDQDTVMIFKSDSFHIVFVEIGNRTYYLTVLQQEFVSNTTISSKVTESNRCPFINELFNASFVEWHLLRRMKYYHIPCKERKNLLCFYDEIHMCICNHDLQQANCFTFNHSMVHNCQGEHHCENNGSCILGPTCSNPFICVCNECSYGSRCQFSTKNFVLSLDIILGHQIQPFVPFVKQRSSIKVIILIVSLMFICGLASSILSILTFQTKNAREVGSGCYLFVSSWNSIIVMIIFALKIYLLILSQMTLITNRTYLSFNCILMDFFVKIFVNTSDWLNAFVGIDRALVATKNNEFNQNKSKRVAKWIIGCIYIVTIVTHIQDPIYRRLIDDEEENRIWCILSFSPHLRVFNSLVLFLHFVLPFLINIISAFIIIFNVARRRSILQKQQPYRQHLGQQFYKFKHLLISPLVLTILASPQLIISFMSRCMYSFRNPWLFVFGYFISFLPSALIFFVFVLPSKTYKNELSETIRCIRQRICRA